MHRSRWIQVLVLLVLTSCGGTWDFEDTLPGEAGDPSPDVVLLIVSGHTDAYDGIRSYSYLHEEYGPTLEADLEVEGYTVHVDYYVDDPDSTDAAGYHGLIADMTWIRDHWVDGQAEAPRIVLIAHSHGGVWATAATREVHDLPIDFYVSLDTSSVGWDGTDHDSHDDAIGGSPKDAYFIESASPCDRKPRDDPADSPWYDLEDVVFPSVRRSLEIRSGEPWWFHTDEPYDARWNVRLDGTVDGLECFYSDTNHQETRATHGPSYRRVWDFLTNYLDR